ncbi:MAG TPA: protein phosphatase CheZ [Rhodopila sp.]|jgi:chemotaxis protein CheZ|nr:protein phosphatase CheZ [Rhodopila sp.]
METTNTTNQLPDAHDYLDRVIRELRALKAPQKDTLVGVLQYLSDHIRATRAEIGAIRGGASGDQLFGSTADELEEIVTETARAANRIMDAAETIEGVAGKVDPASAAALTDAVTKIYEASSFQDITGQRITKVVRALQSMETKLQSLAGAFGRADFTPAAAVEGDAALLNGPQLAQSASSQDDIDALFGDLAAE